MKHETFEHDLSGGGRALIIHLPNSPTTAIEAYFLGGYAVSDKSKFDLPHLTEHLMLSGTKLHPTATEFNVAVQENGAYLNAHTGSYFNSYDYICANFEVERILSLLADQITGPLFPERSFLTEKGNVSEELTRNTSNYGRKCSLALMSKTHSNSVLTDDSRLAQLGTITRDDVFEYYRTTHTAANLRLLISGEVTDGGQQLIKRFNELIKGWRIGKRQQLPLEPVWSLDAPLIDPQPIKSIYYSLHSYLRRPLSFDEEVRLDLLARLFCGRYDSWIYGEARERGIAYSVGASAVGGNLTSFLGLQSQVSRDNAVELFRIFAKHWLRAKSGEFTNKEVSDAIKYMLGLYARRYETAAGLMSWYQGDFAFFNKVNRLEDYFEALKQLKRDDIVEAANLITSEKLWGLSLVGNVDQKLGDQLFEVVQGIWA